MDRSVPDTSFLVSSFIFPRSIPAEALHRLEEETSMLASDDTLDELQQVLLRDKFERWMSLAARENLYASFVDLVEEIVPITETITACRDPKDDKFLSLAVSGNASLILTGDHDLLVLHPFRGIDILAPAAYLQR